MDMASKIRMYRERNRMYQSELGKALGVTAQAVSKWELGRAEPDAASIIKMCELFGITADDLLGRGTQAQDDLDKDLWSLREQYRRDPSTRILFDAAKGASPNHLKAAAAMLKALEPEDDGGYFPDE